MALTWSWPWNILPWPWELTALLTSLPETTGPFNLHWLEFLYECSCCFVRNVLYQLCVCLAVWSEPCDNSLATVTSRRQ